MPPVLDTALDLLLHICGHCAEPFGTSDRRSRYCSQSCAQTAKRRYGKARQARYRDAHPTREQARQVLKNAVMLGKVRRALRCEQCGEVGTTEGHHEDYTRPFYVLWVCRACHAALDDGHHFHSETPGLRFAGPSADGPGVDVGLIHTSHDRPGYGSGPVPK